MPSLIYITHFELTDEPPSEDKLTEILASLERAPAFAMLAMLDLLLSLFYRSLSEPETQRVHDDVTSYLLDDRLFELLRQRFPRESPLTRPLFHRQQLLALARRVLLESPEAAGDNPFETSNARFRLGTACLMMNDHLVSADQTERLLSNIEHDAGLDELLCQWLPVVELMNPPDEGQALVRTREYVKIIEKQFSDLQFSTGEKLTEVFDRINHISLETHLFLVYCIHVFYATQEYKDIIENLNNLKFKKSTMFARITLSEGEIDRFLELNARKIEGLIKELKTPLTREPLRPQYDFTAFRKYPLVHFDNDILTCIDVNFLIEKLGPGVYHSILNSFDNDADKRLFSASWGKVFERYVNKLLEQVYPPRSGRFYATAKFDRTKSEHEAFDGAIDYGESLIVMEHKGGFLSAALKYSGRTHDLLSELDKKFGRERHAGVEQLARKIEVIFNAEHQERKTFSQLDVRRIRKVYPVLIAQDLSLQTGLANWRLRRWFEQEIAKRKLDSNMIVRPLCLITIDNLERLVPYLEAGDFTFTDILDEYGLGAYQPHETFRDAIIAFRKKREIPHRPNELVLRRYEEMSDFFKSFFFG
jgi:hypothetical protein